LQSNMVLMWMGQRHSPVFGRPGAGEWPMAAEETARLFELGAHHHQEAILAHGRKLVAGPPTNQSGNWASLLVRYGTEEDRQATVAKLMSDLAGSDDDHLHRALYELSQIPEFVDREAIGARLQALIKGLGHPRESTPGYNLQTGAVRLWDKLASRATPVDYVPVLPLALANYYEHFEEAFALVLNMAIQPTAQPSAQT
jgi:hypothetical protein